MDSTIRYAAGERESRMLRIEAAHVFPVSVREGFDYITDLDSWKSYWPNFVRIRDPAAASWKHPGDNVAVVVRLLNRERELSMVLEQYKPHTLVTYFSSQSGLPDAHHERHFRAVAGGFEYRLLVSYVPRRGLPGLFDRSLVRRAVTRTLIKTIRNLDALFKSW